MNHRAGYSLFEVLIAFVIMSLVLAALIPGQARLLGRAAVQEQQLLAHDFALSRLALLDVGVLAPGTQQDLYREWQVTTIIAQGGPIGADIGAFTVSITINDLQGQQLAQVTTLKVAQ